MKVRSGAAKRWRALWRARSRNVLFADAAERRQEERPDLPNCARHVFLIPTVSRAGLPVCADQPAQALPGEWI